MLCDICHQNDASIIIQGNIKGYDKHTMHICNDCAIEKGLNIAEGIIDSLELSELLYNMAGTILATDKNNIYSKDEKHSDLKCEVCNLGFDDFHKYGRFGCENCYDVYSEILSEALLNMHKGVQHLGKTILYTTNPKSKINYKKEIVSLQKKLKQVVQKEEYEKAASLRDQIKTLNDIMDNSDER